MIAVTGAAGPGGGSEGKPVLTSHQAILLVALKRLGIGPGDSDLARARNYSNLETLNKGDRNTAASKIPIPPMPRYAG